MSNISSVLLTLLNRADTNVGVSLHAMKVLQLVLGEARMDIGRVLRPGEAEKVVFNPRLILFSCTVAPVVTIPCRISVSFNSYQLLIVSCLFVMI